VDAIIFREDGLAERFPAALASPDNSYPAVYTTLFNLTRFYNTAALILVRKIGPEGVEEILKKLKPDGLVLSETPLEANELVKLKMLSESKQIAGAISAV
jgi:hypothetical protein